MMSQKALDEYSENFDRIFNPFNDLFNKFIDSLKLDVRMICLSCIEIAHMLHVAPICAKFDQDVDLYNFQRRMEAFRVFAEKYEKAPDDVNQWGESLLSIHEVMIKNPLLAR